MNPNRKKPLSGCVLCRDCADKTAPKPVGILTSKDMTTLGYSGCLVDSNNYLTEGDRKCANYKKASHDEYYECTYCRFRLSVDQYLQAMFDRCPRCRRHLVMFRHIFGNPPHICIMTKRSLLNSSGGV